MKIALGTVQFGLNYGIANSNGQVSPDEAKAIIDFGSRQGIDTLDTAIAYGESEQRLGEIGVDGWQVVSKLPGIPEDVSDVEAWVEEAVDASLKRLRIPKLYGLLLHRSHELLFSHGKSLYSALVALKREGKVDKIGVSVYGTEELDAVLSHFDLDLIQAPFNIIDRRLSSSGWLSRLYKAGVEVHTRSVFLQGLLLMDPAERPARFIRWQSLWEKWREWLFANEITPIQACLAFALSHDEITRVVVGVDSFKQLQEIISYAQLPEVVFPADFMSNDEELINPSLWSAS